MGAALHRAFPWVDVVVRGEAERLLPDLVRDLIAGNRIRPAPRPLLPARRPGSRGPAVRRRRRAHGRDSHAEVRRVLRATRQDGLRLGGDAGGEAALRDIPRVLVGGEVPLHVPWAQRDHDGLPQQERRPRGRGADAARAAPRSARLHAGRHHPRHAVLPGRPAPAGRGRPRPEPLLRDEGESPAGAGPPPPRRRRELSPAGHREPQHPILAPCARGSPRCRTCAG